MFRFKFLSLMSALTLLFFAQVVAGNGACRSLFIDKASLQQSLVTELSLSIDPARPFQKLNWLPEQAREQARLGLKVLFEKVDLANLHQGARIVLNLSPKDKLHVVSQGLNPQAQTALRTLIEGPEILNLLRNIPPAFRNKYFEIYRELNLVEKGRVQVQAKFAWELSIAVQSQLLSGFAQDSSTHVRSIAKKHQSDLIRQDLIRIKVSQESLVTCGLASLTQVLTARGIKITEDQILDLTESIGVKKKADIFGPTPGLELAQLEQVAVALGKKYSFTIAKKYVRSQSELDEFVKSAKLAAEGKNVDVIVNYNSPVVSRPGAGHFSPVGGVNRITNEILLSETNLAANPAYWVQSNKIFEAMVSPAAEGPRGYLLINWPTR